jgi:hypothetical protein
MQILRLTQGRILIMGFCEHIVEHFDTIKARNFLTHRAIINFSKKTLYHRSRILFQADVLLQS